MPQTSLQRIVIDSEWSLVDLYEFPHCYTQVYAFLYSISQTGELNNESVSAIYQRHPWRGGYSAVNFYADLYYAMDEAYRPMVNAISYASLGFIEITALVFVATQIRQIVSTVAQSIEIVDETYHRMYKRAQERKLLAIDVRKHERELAHDDIKFLKQSSEELAKLMNFQGLSTLQERTRDQLGTFKILLSVYRRVRELAKFQLLGKIKLDANPRELDDKRT